MRNEQIGYPVTAKKMWFLTLATMGLWTTYWLFINFQSFRRKEITGIHFCPETYTGLVCLSYYNLLEFIEITGRARGLSLSIAKKRAAFLMLFVGFPALMLGLFRQETVFQILFLLTMPLFLESARKAIWALNVALGTAFDSKFGPVEKLIFAIGFSYWAIALFANS